MSDPFPAEMQAIKDLLKNLIQASNDIEHIKTHIRYALGLAGDTPEMQQLHSMIVNYDRRFEDQKAELAQLRNESKREFKIIKYALAGIAAGTPVIQFFLNVLGMT